jgi:hypothetical protein
MCLLVRVNLGPSTEASNHDSLRMVEVSVTTSYVGQLLLSERTQSSLEEPASMSRFTRHSERRIEVRAGYDVCGEI